MTSSGLVVIVLLGLLSERDTLIVENSFLRPWHGKILHCIVKPLTSAVAHLDDVFRIVWHELVIMLLTEWICHHLIWIAELGSEEVA